MATVARCSGFALLHPDMSPSSTRLASAAAAFRLACASCCVVGAFHRTVPPTRARPFKSTMPSQVRNDLCNFAPPFPLYVLPPGQPAQSVHQRDVEAFVCLLLPVAPEGCQVHAVCRVPTQHYSVLLVLAALESSPPCSTIAVANVCPVSALTVRERTGGRVPRLVAADSLTSSTGGDSTHCRVVGAKLADQALVC